jgi:hypothetical protein
MKPLVDLPDPERKAIAALEAAGHPNVTTDFPDEPLTGTDYVLQVDLENSDVTNYPVAEYAQVRITAHVARGRRTAVKQHVADALADLYVFADADVAGVIPRGGRSAVSSDPTTKNLMCWGLVDMTLIATTVTP